MATTTLETQLLTEIRNILAELLALSKSKRAAKAEPAVAVDLDGQYGDPLIKAKSPREWSGPDMLGRHLSECPPEYLDMLAARYDYFAGKEEDPKKKHYAVLDAAKCRAWAARLRSGWKPKPSPMTSSEDIPW